MNERGTITKEFTTSCARCPRETTTKKELTVPAARNAFCRMGWSLYKGKMICPTCTKKGAE